MKACGKAGVVIAVFVVIIASIALIASSLKKVQSHEVGLKYDPYAKTLADEFDDEGLYTGVPGFRFIKFPRVFRTAEFISMHCLNKDGVTVSLHITFQYRARFDALKSIIEEFRDYDTYKKIMTRIAKVGVHDICSTFDTSQFQTHRGDFQANTLKRISFLFNQIRCDIAELQVNDIIRPVEFDAAIESKEEAREDIKVAEQEAPKALTEAQTRNKTVSKKAEINVDRALSEARIRLDKAMQTAQAVENAYRQEARVYSDLMTTLDLDPNGLLAYMGVRNIEFARRTVHVSIKEPAATSHVVP